MFERLDQIEARYEELTQALASPDIVNDSARYQKTAKAHSEIVPMVEKYREYKDLTRGIAESKAMLAEEKDPEMRAYAQEELNKLEPRVAAIEEELKVLLLPKDPNDEKNIILEIRAGPEETKPRSSPRRSSACTHATRKPSIGRLRCSLLRSRRPAA
jgi:peptide chain release factor 1